MSSHLKQKPKSRNQFSACAVHERCAPLTSVHCVALWLCPRACACVRACARGGGACCEVWVWPQDTRRRGAAERPSSSGLNHVVYILLFNSHTVLCATRLSRTQVRWRRRSCLCLSVTSTILNPGRIPARHASRTPHHARGTRKWPHSRRLRLALGWVPLALAGRLIAVVRLARVRILRRVPAGWQL